MAPPARPLRRRALALLAGLALAGAVHAEPARRVISLNPSLTAIALALGARPQLVGVDDFSARQEPEVRELPRVGGLYDPSLEAVMGLSPDLVVLVPSAEQRSFQEQLAALGVARFVADPVSYDDVLETIRALGARLGRDEAAARRVAELQRARERAQEASAGRPRLRTVLILQRDPLFVAGAGTFVDDMLRAVGAENLGAALGGKWPRASREWLLAQEPQLLLDSSDDPAPAAEFWSRWPSLRARVVSLPAGLVTLPGPHLDRALALLEAALRDPESKSRGQTPEFRFPGAEAP